MSAIKLDLKQFKHVKSDKNSTTLQHKDGHQLTIAHGSMSPEAREQLDALAKGGKVDYQEGVNKQHEGSKPGVSEAGNRLDTDEHKKNLHAKTLFQMETMPNPKLKGLAEGGNIPFQTGKHETPREKGNPKLEESNKQPPVRKAPKSETSYEDKASNGFGKVTHKLADGGSVADSHECQGAKFCMHCGGEMPKMYAEGTLDAQAPGDEVGGDLVTNVMNAPASSVNDGNPVPMSLPSPTPGTQGRELPEEEQRAKRFELTPEQIEIAKQNHAAGRGGPVNTGAPQSVPQSQDDSDSDSDEDESAPAPKPVAKGPKPILDDLQRDTTTDQAAQRNLQTMSYNDHLQNASTELGKEAQAMKQDFASGQIQPKTIADLMHDKTIFQRVGTAFGLLLGGIGSGLTGQPNAMLGLLQKQIDQDFEAQGKNITNAQNLRKMNWDHQEQLQRTSNMAKTGNLTDAQTALAKTENRIKGDTNARLAINFGIAKKLADIVASLPPGDPKRVQAEEQLASLNGTLNASNSNLLGVAASRIATLKTLGGNGNNAANTGDPNQFRAEQNLLNMSPETAHLATDREKRFINGIGIAPAGEVTQGKKQQLENANLVNLKGKQIMQMIKDHGALSESWPSTEQQRLAQMVGEFSTAYGNSIPISQTEGGRNWLDAQLTDKPGSIMARLRHEPERFKEVIDSNAQRLDQSLSGPGGLGFPKGTVNRYLTNKLMPNSDSQDQGKPGLPAKDKHGVLRPTVIIGGKAYFK